MAKLKHTTISRRTVAALKADRDTVFWDSELLGFGVRVYPTGRKVYVVQTRAGGKDGKRVTVDHHGQGPSLRRCFENDCPERAWHEDLDQHFSLGRGGGHDAHACRALGVSADPNRPPALPDRHRRPALGQRSGAVPDAGKRGVGSGTGTQRAGRMVMDAAETVGTVLQA